MKLSDFLKSSELSVVQMAENIGVTRGAVYKYLRGEKTPSNRTMQRIYVATGGQVTANDFYDLPKLPKHSKSPVSRASPG